MTASESTPPRRPAPLTSRGYQMTIDGGPDSIFALSIEEPDSETAWLVSDTVHALKNMR